MDCDLTAPKRVLYPAVRLAGVALLAALPLTWPDAGHAQQQGQAPGGEAQPAQEQTAEEASSPDRPNILKM